MRNYMLKLGRDFPPVHGYRDPEVWGEGDV